jgi:hypothetical protein
MKPTYNVTRHDTQEVNNLEFLSSGFETASHTFGKYNVIHVIKHTKPIITAVRHVGRRLNSKYGGIRFEKHWPNVQTNHNKYCMNKSVINNCLI